MNDDVRRRVRMACDITRLARAARAFVPPRCPSFVLGFNAPPPTALRGAEDDVQPRVGVHHPGHLANLQGERAVLRARQGRGRRKGGAVPAAVRRAAVSGGEIRRGRTPPVTRRRRTDRPRMIRTEAGTSGRWGQLSRGFEKSPIGRNKKTFVAPFPSHLELLLHLPWAEEPEVAPVPRRAAVGDLRREVRERHRAAFNLLPSMRATRSRRAVNTAGVTLMLPTMARRVWLARSLYDIYKRSHATKKRRRGAG